MNVDCRDLPDLTKIMTALGSSITFHHSPGKTSSLSLHILSSCHNTSDFREN